MEFLKPFGAFVSLPGFRRHGLVAPNAVSADFRFSRDDADEAKLQALSWACPLRSRVFVKVTDVQPDARGGNQLRISLSMRAVDQTTGADMDPDNRDAAAASASDAAPLLGAVLGGSVLQLRPFGIFVSLDGYRKNGLVHSSQVSEHLRFSRDDADGEKVAALSGVLSVGERVFVKVVEVETDDSGRLKLGCSLKLVDQRTGADLDPSGKAYRPRGARLTGDEEGEGQRRREAGGLVDWGHHAASVKQLDGGSYNLVASDEDGGAEAPGVDPRLVPSIHAERRNAAGGEAAFLLGGEGECAIGSREEAEAILERHRRKEARRAEKEARRAERKERKSGRKERKKDWKEKKEKNKRR